MGETPETGEPTDVTSGVARRTVLRGTAGLGVGAVAGVAASGEAAARTSKPDAATTIAAAERVAAAQDPFLRRKQLLMFKIADVNGDGALTPDDTIQLVHRLARLTGYADDSPRTQRMVATVNRMWQFVVTKPAWVPNLERFDAEQFVTMEANTIIEMPDKYLRNIGIVTNAVFAMADTDHDGLISRDEAIQIGTEFMADTEFAQVSRERAEYAWTVLDSDDDGYLDYADCLMAITDLLVSTDPNAPSNLALGQFLSA